MVPSTPQDAQDLLIAATLCDDPVVYIDDRWLYEIDDEVTEPKSVDLRTQGPKVLREGQDAAHGARLLAHYSGFYQGDVQNLPHFAHAA